MMGRIKWLLAAYVAVLGSRRLASANPPARPSQSALVCPQLPPLWRGALRLVVGRYEQAIAVCDELLRDNPNNQRAYALRGYAHLLKRDDPRQAIADFSEVLRRNPDNAAIHVARARAYDQTKEYDRTIADCTEAIHLDPRSSEAYATRGECYEWKKVSRKALADYTAALRIAPKFTWARGKRARAYMKLGEGARALADFEELGRQLPENREVKNGICQVYFFNFREYDRVIADAGELIRQDPSEPRWYWLRGWAHLAKGEYVPGCCDAVVAILLNPRRVQIRISSHSLFVFIVAPKQPIFIFVRENKAEEVIEALTKRLKGDQNNLAAYYERAYAYMAKRDYKRAVADYDQIIRLDPADAEAYRARGNLHVDLGAYTDALKDFAEVMRLDPGYAESYTRRARAYAAMGKYEEALRDCTESLRLDPRFVLTYSLRGCVYERCEKYDRAIADFSEAIRLSPADPDLYQRRGTVRFRVWDYAGAIADYKRAVKLAPTNADACSKLAKVLCCCPDARLRDGKEAQKLAKAACEASSWRDWRCLASLGAACAECGDFDAAVKWETKAGQIAPDWAKSTTHQQLLKLYRAHKPYRSPPPRGTSESPSSKRIGAGAFAI